MSAHWRIACSVLGRALVRLSLLLALVLVVRFGPTINRIRVHNRTGGAITDVTLAVGSSAVRVGDMADGARSDAVVVRWQRIDSAIDVSYRDKHKRGAGGKCGYTGSVSSAHVIELSGGALSESSCRSGLWLFFTD